MRLLNKTITVYFIYSTILLAIAIPTFYFVLKKLMVQNIDEQLISTKTLIIPQLANNIINHRENNLVYSGYDIHYEKKSRITLQIPSIQMKQTTLVRTGFLQTGYWFPIFILTRNFTTCTLLHLWLINIHC